MYTKQIFRLINTTVWTQDTVLADPRVNNIGATTLFYWLEYDKAMRMIYAGYHGAKFGFVLKKLNKKPTQ